MGFVDNYHYPSLGRSCTRRAVRRFGSSIGEQLSLRDRRRPGRRRRGGTPNS